MTRQHYTEAKTLANTRSKTWTPSSSPPRASSSAPKQWPQRCIAATLILSMPLGTFEFVESRATSGRTTNNGVPGLSFGRTTARPTLVSSFYCLNGTESRRSHGTTENKRAANLSSAHVACQRVTGGGRRVFVVERRTDVRTTTTFRTKRPWQPAKKGQWDCLLLPIPPPPVPLPFLPFCARVRVFLICIEARASKHFFTAEKKRVRVASSSRRSFPLLCFVGFCGSACVSPACNSRRFDCAASLRPFCSVREATDEGGFPLRWQRL